MTPILQLIKSFQMCPWCCKTYSVFARRTTHQNQNMSMYEPQQQRRKATSSYIITTNTFALSPYFRYQTSNTNLRLDNDQLIAQGFAENIISLQWQSRNSYKAWEGDEKRIFAASIIDRI